MYCYLLISTIRNKNVDIYNLVRTTHFWNNLHQATLKMRRLESQILQNYIGIKPKSLNRIVNKTKEPINRIVNKTKEPIYRIVNISKGHLCLKDENLSLGNTCNNIINCFNVFRKSYFRDCVCIIGVSIKYS